MGQQPILCYVEDSWAYFTTQPLDTQWGDDWNDAPYEHNAGRPYTYLSGDKEQGREPWKIVTVAWEGPLEMPSTWTQNSNSTYSVEMINSGVVAWLRTDRYATRNKKVVIPAGTTLADFIDLVYEAGGTVYTEVRQK